MNPSARRDARRPPAPSPRPASQCPLCPEFFDESERLGDDPQPVVPSPSTRFPRWIAAATFFLAFPALAEDPPQQMHSVTLGAGSGLSLGSAGGNATWGTHSPAFLDVRWRTWHSTEARFVYGLGLRAEVDGRTSIGVVPRFEFSRTVRRTTLRPGLGFVYFFAPFRLAGPEASLAVEFRLGSVVSLQWQLLLDVFFIGNDVPAQSAIFAANGVFGVTLHL